MSKSFKRVEMAREEMIEYVHLIDIAVLPGAVQRNGNKVHGL